MTALTGAFGVLDDFVALESHLELWFDDAGMIRDWASYFAIGSDADFSIGRQHGDTYAYYPFGEDPFSGAPGTWTRTPPPADAAPAPVPLPASGLMLLAGSLAMGGVAARRKRRDV